MALAEWAGLSELISTKCSRQRHLLLVAVEDHGDGTEHRDEKYGRDEHPADFPGGHRAVHQAAYQTTACNHPGIVFGSTKMLLTNVDSFSRCCERISEPSQV